VGQKSLQLYDCLYVKSKV